MMALSPLICVIVVAGGVTNFLDCYTMSVDCRVQTSAVACTFIFTRKYLGQQKNEAILTCDPCTIIWETTMIIITITELFFGGKEGTSQAFSYHTPMYALIVLQSSWLMFPILQPIMGWV